MKEYVYELRRELTKVCSMTESEVMSDYGESRDDVITELERQIERYEREEDEEIPVCSTYHLDEAFGSWEEVNRMFV